MDSPASSSQLFVVQSATRQAVRRRLLHWFDQHKRDLPWRRRTDDPYAQWVAEIMLQQTRVETAIPYYERFLARFPDVRSLARANRDELLKHWEGLGYYRRVLNLHRAALLLVESCEEIPRSAAELARLPGIGSYTAAAIASIAFDEPVAAVDGNVARIIARLFQIEADILTGPGKRQVQRIADQLIPAARPGDFNQAWMDFANAVCTPTSPKCDNCPLATLCGARTGGNVDRLPIRGAGRNGDVPTIRLVVALITIRGGILMRKRPESGLWSGMWELPNVEVSGVGNRAERQWHRLVHETLAKLLESLKLTGTPDVELQPMIEHKLTHRRLELHGVVAKFDRTPRLRFNESARWVNQAQLAKLAVPIAFRKVLRPSGY